MSFLDNLENNLKALESREEKDPALAAQRRTEAEQQRKQQLAAAPHAKALKESPFTAQLLTAARAAGHRRRVMVRFTWLEETLRLEAGSRRMDLIPTGEGIRAVQSEDGKETSSELVNLSGSPEELATRWLA